MTALAPAPAAAVSADGQIAFGTYLGRTGPVDWAGAAGVSGFRRRRRWKRWHYVSVAGPDVLLAVAVVNIGWASSAFAYVFDRGRRVLAAEDSAVRSARAGAVSATPGGAASTSFHSARLFVRLHRQHDGRWRLAARSRAMTVDATLVETDGGPTVCAIAPVPGGIVDCTHKTPSLATDGLASAGGRTIELGGSFGALDHTSGLLARDTEWRWASATDGDLSLNLTESFTAPAENVLWHGGEVTPLGPVRFDFDRRRPERPWHISGAGCELVFRPEGVRAQHSNLLLAKSIYTQPIGTFSGTVAGVHVEGLPGVTEDHVARW